MGTYAPVVYFVYSVVEPLFKNIPHHWRPLQIVVRIGRMVLSFPNGTNPVATRLAGAGRSADDPLLWRRSPFLDARSMLD